MEYIIAILAFCVAIFALDKDLSKLRKRAIIISSLIICGLSAYQINDNHQKEKYSKHSGKFKFKLKHDNKYLSVTIGNRLGGVRFGDSCSTCQVDLGGMFDKAGLHGIDLRIRKENDLIKVYTTIRDTNGEVIGAVNGDEWQTSLLNLVSDRNFDDKGIEFIDRYGDVIFQMDFINDYTLFINGVFCNKTGQQAGFVGLPDGGAQIEMKVLPGKGLELGLKPIFKYPSEQHFGEREPNKPYTETHTFYRLKDPNAT